MSAVELAYDSLHNRIVELQELAKACDFREDLDDEWCRYQDETEDLEQAMELIKYWQ